MQLRHLAIIAAVLTISACMPVEELIDVRYVLPPPSVVRSEAQAIAIKIAPSDQRTVNQDRVSNRIDGLRRILAPIRSMKPVPAIIGTALADGLRGQGYQVKENGRTIRVEIEKFFSDYEVKLFGADAHAEIIVTILVPGTDFKGTYQALFTEPKNAFMSGPGAEAALNGALAKLVPDILGDDQFHAALARRAAIDAGRLLGQ